jgi:hypothetical protein
MAHYFLGRLPGFPEQEACFVLDYLRQAPILTKGADPELRVRLLNQLDPHLDSSNGNLVLAVARLLVCLVAGEEKLVPSLAARLAPLLSSWVRRSSGVRDFQAVLLDFLLSLQEPDYQVQLARYLKQLYVRGKDPPEIGKRKVELMARMATPDNCVEIMNYLLNLVQRPAEARLLNQAALAASCAVARQDETCYDNLLQNLDLLVRTDRAAYFELVLELVPLLGLTAAPGGADHDKMARNLVTSLLAATVPEQASRGVVLSVLTLLEEFGCLAGQGAAQLLEDLWRLDRSGWSPELYRRCLAAAYALFLAFPAAMQPVLGRILHACSQLRDHQIRFLVHVYYQLLISLPADKTSL